GALAAAPPARRAAPAGPAAPRARARGAAPPRARLAAPGPAGPPARTQRPGPAPCAGRPQRAPLRGARRRRGPAPNGSSDGGRIDGERPPARRRQVSGHAQLEALLDLDPIDPARDRVWAVEVTVRYTTYVVAETSEKALEVAEDATGEDSRSFSGQD